MSNEFPETTLNPEQLALQEAGLCLTQIVQIIMQNIMGDKEATPELIAEANSILEGIYYDFDASLESAHFSLDGNGAIHYPTIIPWRVDPSNPKNLDFRLDEEALEQFPDEITDPEKGKEFESNYSKLLSLYEKTKEEHKRLYKENLRDCREEVRALLELFSLYEINIEELRSITTREEALKSEKRVATKLGLGKILKLLQTIENETDISEEDRRALWEKYKTLSRAVGIISGGFVDHER